MSNLYSLCFWQIPEFCSKDNSLVIKEIFGVAEYASVTGICFIHLSFAITEETIHAKAFFWIVYHFAILSFDVNIVWDRCFLCRAHDSLVFFNAQWGCRPTPPSHPFRGGGCGFARENGWWWLRFRRIHCQPIWWSLIHIHETLCAEKSLRIVCGFLMPLPTRKDQRFLMPLATRKGRSRLVYEFCFFQIM